MGQERVDPDRELWLTVRRALLAFAAARRDDAPVQQLIRAVSAAIERRYGLKEPGESAR